MVRAVTRRELIRRFRSIGFEGPIARRAASVHEKRSVEGSHSQPAQPESKDFAKIWRSGRAHPLKLTARRGTIIEPCHPIAIISTRSLMPFQKLRYKWLFPSFRSSVKRKSSTQRLQTNWMWLAQSLVTMSRWKKSAADSGCDPQNRVSTRRGARLRSPRSHRPGTN
jgi:hypothetical protein